MLTPIRLLLLLIGLIHLAPTAQADTISIRGDEWCPFNCAPGSKTPGFMIEVATKVFEKKGHKVDYQTLNWARAIQATRDGKFTAIVGSLKEDAPDFVFPDEELGLSVEGFLVKKGNPWRWQGVESLEKVLLGVVNDYAYSEPVGEYIKKHRQDKKRVALTSGDDTLQRNIRMLIRGRLDVIVESVAVIGYTLATNPNLAKEVEQAGQLETSGNLYIAFSPTNPKSPAYAKILTEGIAEMRKSGELKAILKTYGLVDWRA